MQRRMIWLGGEETQKCWPFKSLFTLFLTDFNNKDLLTVCIEPLNVFNTNNFC